MKKRHKKSGNKTTSTEKVLLVTAIISLIIKLIELIEKLID